MMSRRDDLEKRIRASYDVVHQYEEIVQVSDRPEEVQRARHQIEEQWRRIREPLVEYLAISRRRGLAVPDDVAEIAATFGPELEEAVAAYRAPVLSLSTDRRWIYTVGVPIVAVLVLAVLLLPRLFGPEAAPEPSPTLPPSSPPETSMPTVISTSTPRPPTPTATPVFRQGALYRVAIAEFDGQKASRQIEIVRRLEDDLRANLEAAGLRESVDLRVLSDVIDTEDRAREFAAGIESDVLIWGWYDDLGIRLYVLLGEAAEAGGGASPQMTGLRELPVNAVNETSELSFYVHDVLPSNTTFLSMFVIGHLYYLSNNYVAGYDAFDAAMANIPEMVALENEALPHFFNARLMQTGTQTDTTEIVCEYARAIELDPDLFEAYNNLAVLMMSVCELRGSDCTSIYEYAHRVCYDTAPYEELPCVEAADIPSLEPADLISQALRIRPDWALARFNLAAIHWNTMYGEDPASVGEYVEHFETVVELDPTIAGAHILLGNMAMWDEDYDRAVERYTTAMDLWPDSPELAVNLGQALALAGRDEEAVNVYHQALALTEEGSAAYREAHLALGNLYHCRGDLERALEQYQLLEPTGTDEAFDSTLSLAMAKIEIDNGAWDRATQRLETSCGSDYCPGYLIWLIQSIQAGSEIDALFYVRGPGEGFFDWTRGHAPYMMSSARRNIEEQQALVERYLDEYLSLCRQSDGPVPSDIQEIAVRFPCENDELPPHEANRRWNTAAIRDLLSTAFSDEDLNALCFDTFPAVYENFTTEMSKYRKIHLLLEHCVRQQQMNELLRHVREQNPVQYRRHQGRLRS